MCAVGSGLGDRSGCVERMDSIGRVGLWVSTPRSPPNTSKTFFLTLNDVIDAGSRQQCMPCVECGSAGGQQAAGGIQWQVC